MWEWVAIGGATYTALVLLVLSLARSAAAADRSERAVFRAWRDERRGRLERSVHREQRPPKAA